MHQGRLTDDRLSAIEQGARDRGTLSDRVMVELVNEIRALRQLVGRLQQPSESSDGGDGIAQRD